MKKTILSIAIIVLTFGLTSCDSNINKVENIYKELVKAAKDNNTALLKENLSFLSQLSDKQSKQALSKLMSYLKKDIPYKIKFDSDNTAILRRNDGFVLFFKKTENDSWIVSQNITLKQSIEIVPAKK